jgi:uncharacterized protein YbjT (DUF2867 family)
MAAAENCNAMKIAILGSTGQVGSYITERIRADFPTSDIKACSRTEREGHFLFRPFEDDWNKLGKVDVIINSVGIIDETKELTFEKAHEGLTKLILENRGKIGNPRVIQLSVLGADTNSKVPFMSTKAKADEELLKQANTVVVRPSIVCTHGTMIVQKLKMLKGISRYLFGFMPLPAPMLKTKLQPVMGEDVAALVSELCVTNHTGIINAVGPEHLTLKDLMAYMPQITIIKMPKWLTDPVIKVMMKIMPSLINPAQYELLFKDNIADRKPAENILGKAVQNTRQFWREELGN